MSEFTEALKKGDFSLARSLMFQYERKTIEDELFLLAYEGNSIAPYGFVCAILQEEETSEWHHTASVLLSHGINHMADAYYTGFYHAKKAADLSPNDISYKEALLFYHEIPDQPLIHEEALAIANEILKVDPNNKAAKRVN